ncbi:hypothetical protein BRC67_11500 [Halobacteriales archaeon QH_3_68_24]|nr:MAG: hypothetical protein BRC67_11500 [Halobacteriales archaeon QH_3_68_24]
MIGKVLQQAFRHVGLPVVEVRGGVHWVVVLLELRGPGVLRYLVVAVRFRSVLGVVAVLVRHMW